MVPLITQNLSAIEELCKQYGVKRLDVFGSAADGTFEPGRSDVDLLVEFTKKPLEKYADDFWAFLFALEKLFGTRVDLVEVQAQKNRYFMQSVNATKQTLYAA
ncbi:MAG: nucleotidyltransferase domain-containing protein [Candidatus Hydrogenedentes bacterium]|nr:nucleotidyltransferase domain-containing protein [Candidatus Hydrogenedentota bacterium]